MKKHFHSLIYVHLADFHVNAATSLVSEMHCHAAQPHSMTDHHQLHNHEEVETAVHEHSNATA
jgi:hypothetical protein